MIDDDYELASAYSDGELSPAQRAAVEENPAVFALVAEITALRATLAGQLPDTLGPTNGPSAEVKAQHLAAAAAAFDGVQADSHASTYIHVEPEPAGAPVVDLRNQRRYRVLTMAAGFVVVAGVGVAALGGLARSTQDEATDASGLASEAPAAAESLDSSAADESDAETNEQAPEATTAADDADSLADTDAGSIAEPAEAAPVADDVPTDTSAFAMTAGIEASHFFTADTTLDVIFDTVTKDNDAAIDELCRPDLLPPGVDTSSYIVERDGELLQVLVGVHRIATNVILVDGECQPIDELERPTD